MTDGLRVAVACSGLGHVQRGIESWAADLAGGLRQAGVSVTLFGGAPAAGAVALPCLRRTARANGGVTNLFRHLGGWRMGLGSPYEVEQTTFSWALWQRIRRDFDILHVQDPTLAAWLELASRRGLSRPRVIYANGTGEGPSVMRRFRSLQLLTDGAFQDWQPQAPDGQSVFHIPNFVDTTVFAPGDRSAARAKFELPAEKIIVLCCAAIRRVHKRIDFLLRAFDIATRRAGADAMLVIAGGREAETDAIIAEGTDLLGDRVRFLPDVARSDMPELYRAADFFVLASLHEMFGIVLLEAMASGLPVVCNDTEAFRAIVGPAGGFHDAGTEAGLADGISALFDDTARLALGRAARSHVEQRFSDVVVIPMITAMYRSVLADAGKAVAKHRA
jgi:glycosyltransferase involved in cell wall biosynthesis